MKVESIAQNYNPQFKYLSPLPHPKSMAQIVPENYPIATLKPSKVASAIIAPSIFLSSPTGTESVISENSERPMRKKRGILVSSSRKKLHKDPKGIQTERVKKKLRVVFKDEISVGQALAEIIEVESYKEYNQLTSEPPTGCTCAVL